MFAVGLVLCQLQHGVSGSKRSLPQKSRIVGQNETEKMLPSSGSWEYSSRLRVPQEVSSSPCSCCLQAPRFLARRSHQVLCTFQLASLPGCGQAAPLHSPLSPSYCLLWLGGNGRLFLNTEAFFLSSGSSTAASPAAYPLFSLRGQPARLSPLIFKGICLGSAVPFAVTHSHVFLHSPPPTYSSSGHSCPPL